MSASSTTPSGQVGPSGFFEILLLLSLLFLSLFIFRGVRVPPAVSAVSMARRLTPFPVPGRPCRAVCPATLPRRAISGMRRWAVPTPMAAARFCAFRLLVFGPVLAVWMRGLERLVRVPGKRGVAMKIGLDQFVLQPPMLCTFYFR